MSIQITLIRCDRCFARKNDFANKNNFVVQRKIKIERKRSARSGLFRAGKKHHWRKGARSLVVRLASSVFSFILIMKDGSR